MSRQAAAPRGPVDVRAQAVARLTGGPGGQRATSYAADALAVLHDMASSPATADDALALLHELQVHQVELDLQADELRESRVELESALRRQIDLYDLQPVGCFTVDRGGALQELNLTGAAMLGIERDAACGLSLEEFVEAGSRGVLRKLIADPGDGQAVVSSTLRLAAADGAARSVSVHARRDRAGPSVLLVLAPSPSPGPDPQAGTSRWP